jgi:hypothetical protein
MGPERTRWKGTQAELALMIRRRTPFLEFPAAGAACLTTSRFPSRIAA